jgi:hypothetical protein
MEESERKRLKATELLHVLADDAAASRISRPELHFMVSTVISDCGRELCHESLQKAIALGHTALEGRSKENPDYVASSHSNVYHRTNCEMAKKIGKDRRLYNDEARRGRRPHDHCNRHTA